MTPVANARSHWPTLVGLALVSLGNIIGMAYFAGSVTTRLDTAIERQAEDRRLLSDTVRTLNDTSMLINRIEVRVTTLEQEPGPQRAETPVFTNRRGTFGGQ